MADQKTLPDLPLLLAGVPSQMAELLKQAGIPAAPFQATQIIPRKQDEAGRSLVLFDSRRPDSRIEATAAEALGLQTIDLNSLQTSNPAEQPLFELQGREQNQSNLLEILKQEIEKRDGVWLRVADYPYPYQSVLIEENTSIHSEPSNWESNSSTSLLPSLLFSLGRKEVEELDRYEIQPDDLYNWLQRRYAAGLPLILDEIPLNHQENIRSWMASQEKNAFPLLWRTSWSEMVRWWNVRSQISLQVRREKRTYEIHSQGEFGRFRPMVELWRGRHVARLPLQSGINRFSENGIAYQKQKYKSVAGLAGWENPQQLQRHPVPNQLKKTVGLSVGEFV